MKESLPMGGRQIAVLPWASHNLFCRISAIFSLSLCLTGPQVPLAQVAPPITASGLNTQVSAPMNLPSGKVQYDITGGTRPGGGTNLFHSFGDFNVPTNNLANLLNDSGLATSNILGRVTAGNPSNVFGTIQTTGFGNANLFLMNPAGIILGPAATLNLGGMATFTTADYLRLVDGSLFHGTPNAAADALLSAAPVAAFGFLSSNPEAITLQGSQLSVQSGQGIWLVGGNITVQSGTLENGTVQPAQLIAPGGRIHLASVASSGEILTGTLEQASNIPGQSLGALGTIQISEKSVIDASGDGGGAVLIRGGRFVLDDSRVSANTTGPVASTLVSPAGASIDIQVSQDAVIRNTAILETNVSADVAPGVGSGGVHIKADRIEISGVDPSDLEILPFSGIRSNVAAESTGGNSGNIELEANSILVKNHGQLETFTEGTGNAGNIIVTAKQNIEIDNGLITSASAGSANGGNIELTSTQGNIVMTNEPFVTVQANDSSGNAGNITVRAPSGDIVLADGDLFVNVSGVEATGGTGGSGQIQLAANNLQLTSMNVNQVNGSPLPVGNMTVTLSGSLSLHGDSRIFTTTRGPAPSADLNITAHDVHISEGSFLSTETTSSGPGGRLNIFADNLQLTNGGQIRSGSTIGRLPRGRRSVPSGAGGIITIQGLAGPADTVVIDGPDSGIFTDTQGMGAGGNTNVAAQSVTIQNGGVISASTSGTVPGATGGDITITTGRSVNLADGAAVSASSSGPGDAGDIVIHSGREFVSANSSVTTQAAQASGGNITVTAADRVQLTNSQINASVQGSTTTVGGNITIDPQVVILQNSQVLAQATQGTGGNISITTNLLLPDANSAVDASSQTGVSGTVAIQSPISQAAGRIIPLSKNPLQAAALLAQRCAAAPSGTFSSFVVAGSDGMPADPGEWLGSPPAELDGESTLGAVHEIGDRFVSAVALASMSETVSVRRVPSSWPAPPHCD